MRFVKTGGFAAAGSRCFVDPLPIGLRRV